MGHGGLTRASRRWATAGVVVVLLVAVAALAWTVAPPIVAAALTRVAAIDESVRVVRGDRTASIPVPRGWSVASTLGDGSRVALSSPDGVMSVELVLCAATDAATTARTLAPGPTGADTREPAGSGREILHAPTLAGDAVVGSLVDATSAVAFVSSPSPAYDAELARLLDAIEFGP